MHSQIVKILILIVLLGIILRHKKEDVPMTNVLTNIMPKILAKGLLVLREQATMARVVNFDYSNEAAEKGDTIDVPIPSGVPATDVAPGNTPPVTPDTNIQKVQIQLNEWKEAAFGLTDKEMTEIDLNQHFFPMQSMEAIRSLANAINLSILEQYKLIYGFVGTPGTTPFGSSGDAAGVKGATLTRSLLNKQVAPRNERRLVLDFDAEAEALALSQFSDLEKTGDMGVKIEGALGRKFGFDILTDDQIFQHVAGVPGGTPLVNGVHAIGATSLVIKGMTVTTGTYKEGDIITIAGDDQTYVITADITADGSGDATAVISPGLKVATAGDEAITLKANHIVNLAFHRDAFALAMRPLMASVIDYQLGSTFLSMQDPVTGLVLRLEVSRQHKQTRWSFDALWGTKLVRPALACRLAG